MAQMVADLQGQVKLHKSRIRELETMNESAESRRVLKRNTCFDVTDPHVSNLSPRDQLDTHNTFGIETPLAPHDNTPISQPKAFSMDTIDLGRPIATLRSLGDLSLSKDTQEGSAKSSPAHSTLDPVPRGVLSVDDAQKVLNR